MDVLRLQLQWPTPVHGKIRGYLVDGIVELSGGPRVWYTVTPVGNVVDKKRERAMHKYNSYEGTLQFDIPDAEPSDMVDVMIEAGRLVLCKNAGMFTYKSIDPENDDAKEATPWAPKDPTKYEHGCTNNGCEYHRVGEGHLNCKILSTGTSKVLKHAHLCKNPSCYAPKKKQEPIRVAYIRIPLVDGANEHTAGVYCNNWPGRQFNLEALLSESWQGQTTCEIKEEKI